MVRTKNNFTPLHTTCNGFGDSKNEDITDGLTLVMANSDKVTLDAVNKMDKLEQPTPFDTATIPENLQE